MHPGGSEFVVWREGRMQVCPWQSMQVASLQGVRRLRHQLAGLLEWLVVAHGCHLSPVQRERILLLQTELMTNAVKYASPHARYIGFHCWQRHGQCWLEWHDDGGYFNSLQGRRVMASPIADHGYGLYLIRSLAPKIQYRSIQSQNRYRLPLL